MPSRSARKKSGHGFAKASWKDVQFRNKIKRRSKLALIVLAAILGLLIVSWTIRFTQNLFSPGMATAKSRNYTWNGEFNLNLLIRTSAISLLILNPKEEKVVIINIPDETFLDVPRGFGKWQLRAVYELGESSQKGLGGDKLLSETLTSFFGLPIDGFLDFRGFKSQPSAALVVETLRKNPFSGLNLLSALKTDLTAWELFKFKLSINGVRFDKVKILDLETLDVLERGNLADGTAIFIPDPVKIDSILSDLTDPMIVSEHKSIAVFNATDQPQLAQKWARLITNLGGDVIITANAKGKLQETKVIGEDSKTLKRLRQIFGKGGKIGLEDEDLVSSRAQINLFLGEDYLLR